MFKTFAWIAVIFSLVLVPAAAASMPSMTTSTFDFSNKDNFSLKMDFNDYIKIYYEGLRYDTRLSRLNQDETQLIIEPDKGRIDLTIGEIKEIDLDKDNVMDINIKLNDITTKTIGAVTSYEANIVFSLVEHLEVEVEEEADEEEAEEEEEARLSDGVNILSRKMTLKTKILIGMGILAGLVVSYLFYKKIRGF